MANILGEWLSQHGKTQFRTAETEKYPHVTFFFNDYREEPFPGEERGMAASPKVATYDMAPDMSMAAVTVIAREALTSGKYDFVVVNYANPTWWVTPVRCRRRSAPAKRPDLGVGVLLDTVLKLDGHAIIPGPTTATPSRCGISCKTARIPRTRSTSWSASSWARRSRRRKPSSARWSARRCRAHGARTHGLPKPPEMTGESLIVG